ncbi:MAG: ABC transporter permease [Anaerolineae bacterium]|nr:ABC transporter permease [Anaerolineae bacterium]
MSVETSTSPATSSLTLTGILGKIWGNFWVRTIAKKIFIVWVVVTLTFFIIRALPGNPVEIFIIQLMDSGLSEEEARTRAAALMRIDLDAPLSEQYFDYMGNLIKGDLGDSYVLARGKPVADIIFARLPWTLFSVGTSLLISFVLGMFLGMLAAYKRNSWLDHLLTNFSAAIDSIPNTLTAIILVLFLGVIWKVVPLTLMRGSLSPGVQPGFTWEFIADLFKHYAVPGTVYVFSTLGGWMLAMRSSTSSTLGEDYVTVARARGLTDMRIITAYVGRNASLPLVTRLAISLGFVVGGSILIEQIFVYQGVGLLLGQAVAKRDYPVMQGILLVTTITVILSTALADLLYGWLDPRIRIQRGVE